MEAGRALPIHFAEFMTTEHPRVMFSLLAPEVRSILKWLIMVGASAPNKNDEKMKEKADTHTRPLKETIFAWTYGPILKEIGTD